MASTTAPRYLLCELFIQAGGRPERHAPHYFILGKCRWYEHLTPDTQEIRVFLRELPSQATSFTYPDSFTAMGLAPEFGQPYWPQPHHGRVYQMDELAQIVNRYGLPDDAPDDDYDSVHLRPFEKYIEIQLWCDQPVRTYLETS